MIMLNKYTFSPIHNNLGPFTLKHSGNVACEGIPRQVNYLIDEAVATGKGAKATISYVHDFFNFHGAEETDT